jgi:hypothetical protein
LAGVDILGGVVWYCVKNWMWFWNRVWPVRNNGMTKIGERMWRLISKVEKKMRLVVKLVTGRTLYFAGQVDRSSDQEFSACIRH